MKHKYYLSYIACRLSTMTGDHITAAMISIIDGRVSIRVSENKLEILDSILEPHLSEFFRDIVNGYKRAEGKLNYTSVERESRYQNGIVKIFSPSPIALSDVESEREETLDEIFKKHVNTYKYKDENKEENNV